MIDLLKARIAERTQSAGVSASGGEAALEIGLLAPAAPRSRDETAAIFRDLVDAHYRRTFNYILRMIHSESDAADLTQETFVRVYRALPRLREPAAAAAWTRRIATNLCLDHLRRRMAAPALASLDAPLNDESDLAAQRDVADPSGEPDRLFDSAETRRLLHRAIETLPADYRTVIVLHHVEGARVDEIAALLGVPAGTIKSRLSRARRELKRKLSAYFD